MKNTIAVSIFVLFGISSANLQAQGDFKYLFKPVASLCWEVEQNIMLALQKPNITVYETDSMIQLWESYCGISEASRRSKILFDIQFKGGLDSVIPLEYWDNYFDQFENYTWQEDHVQAFYNWTKLKADNLYQQQKSAAYEEIVLLIISSKTKQQALNHSLKKPYYYIKNVAQIYENQEATSSSNINSHHNWLSISYDYYMLTNTLEQELGAMHGLSLGSFYQFNKISIGLNFGFAIAEQKAYLRFDEDGFLTTSDLEALGKFDLIAGYDIYDGRRSKIKALGGLGISFFSTDLYTINEQEEEVSINPYSLYPMLGFDFSRQYYGTRSLGLRSLFLLSNFDSKHLRSELGGSMWVTSLYFRF